MHSLSSTDCLKIKELIEEFKNDSEALINLSDQKIALSTENEQLIQFQIYEINALIHNKSIELGIKSDFKDDKSFNQIKNNPLIGKNSINNKNKAEGEIFSNSNSKHFIFIRHNSTLDRRDFL